MKVIGRIAARGDGIAGVYLPMGGSNLYGIYNVVEIMGELQLQRVGDPAIRGTRFTGVDLEGLMLDRPRSIMTQEELDKVE